MIKRIFLILLIFLISDFFVFADTQTIKIVAVASNPLYGHAKFDVFTGIKERFKQLGYSKIIIKMINYDSKSIDTSFIDSQIRDFMPSFVLSFDNSLNSTTIKNIPIYPMYVYNFSKSLNILENIVKNSNLQKYKFICFYDNYCDIKKEDLELIKTKINAEMILVNSVVKLRDIISSKQKEQNIIFITLLRRIYNIDVGSYYTEPAICREFNILNYKFMTFAFKSHCYKYNIPLSIGQNNFIYGQNIVNRFLGINQQQEEMLVNVDKDTLDKLNMERLIDENFSLIHHISEDDN